MNGRCVEANEKTIFVNQRKRNVLLNGKSQLLDERHIYIQQKRTFTLSSYLSIHEHISYECEGNTRVYMYIHM